MMTPHMAKIIVTRVIWALGDREPHTQSGVTTTTRPLYYAPKEGPRVRVGAINPDYAEPLMLALSQAIEEE